ncbi:MAG TPA: clostripain-related cysteine peptidase [Pyrinomonadaceae bacterium]|jgi:hypothetical protein
MTNKDTSKTTAKSETKEWTVMVYMAGDNNLSQDMITGLKGMMSVGDKANINLIAVYDGNYPTAPIKVYEFSKSLNDKPERPRLEDYVADIELPKPRRTNEADLCKLKDFVPLITERYKARKYALILSGHSDGVIGKTLLRDENPSVSLDLQTLGRILKDVLPKDADGKKKKFDLLGFDGCLMSMIEVGYELKDAAKILVASEGNIPTSGWAYEKILADIISGAGKMDEAEFAKSIVKQYGEFNEDYAVSGRSVNITACNLDNIEPLYKAIQNFAKSLYDLLSLPTEAGEGVTEAEALENKLVKEKFIDWITLSHYRSQTFMHGQAVDIVDFIYNLLMYSEKSRLISREVYGELPKNKTTAKIERKKRAFFNDFLAINKAIKEKDKKYTLASCFVGAEYQFTQGNSIFFPWTRMAFAMIYDKYKSLKFNKTKHWLNLIDKFTSLTIRYHQQTPAFAKSADNSLDTDLISLLHKEVGGKEVGGKEVGGKEVGGKEVGGKEVGGKEVGGKGGTEEFYFYFSQIRNYDTEVFSMGYADETSFI